MTWVVLEGRGGLELVGWLMQSVAINIELQYWRCVGTGRYGMRSLAVMWLSELSRTLPQEICQRTDSNNNNNNNKRSLSKEGTVQYSKRMPAWTNTTELFIKKPTVFTTDTGTVLQSWKFEGKLDEHGW